LKYVVSGSFKADYKRFSRDEQATFKSVLTAFVPACDRHAVDPSVAWPASFRVKALENAPGIMEMTWSFSGPDGRATFEWLQIDRRLGLRWRRIGGHGVFKNP